MKKALLSLFLILPLCAVAQWNDVTSQMLQSPTFDNNSADGWDLNSRGSCNLNSDCLENFGGWFDISQKITAPEGHYRFSCQSYYRAGSQNDAYKAHSNGTEDILAVLYAGDVSTPVPSIYDYSTTGEFSWWGGWYEQNGKQYPDNMQNGANMFAKGYYSVSLEFDHEGGELQLGIKNKNEDFSFKLNDWCMMDNFRLEFKGKMPDIPVEDFFCYTDALDLMPGDTYTLVTYVYPTNATDRDKITWTSSRRSVATVDANGVVTAKAKGTAVITGTCSGFTVTVNVTVIDIDYTGKEWLDVTDEYLKNVNMEDGFDAWNCAPSRVEYTVAEFWNTTFDFYQTVTLPEGDYRFSCEGFFRPTSVAQDAVNAIGSNTHYTYIYAGSRQVPMLDITSERFDQDNGLDFSQVWGNDGSYYLPNGMSSALWCFQNGYYHYSNVVFHTAGSEPVNMGLRCSDYVNGHWAIFDNFRLERLVAMVTTQSLAVKADRATLAVGEVLTPTVTTTPANATFQTFLWDTSNEGVATVDDKGQITAIGAGTAVITVTARDNDKAQATITVTVRQPETVSDALVVNEVMSMNVDRFLDPSFNYGGWIELYNTTSKSISLKGCYITEDKENLKSHRIENGGVVPAHGYYTLWFDHYSPYSTSQIDFKLSVKGDWIAIVSPSGEIMCQIDYPAGIQRCSWARKVDGGTDWAFTAAPTPGKTNATSTWADKQLEAPTVDKPGRIFTGTVKVRATWPSGSTLRYTTDGTTPSASNGKTSTNGIFNISSTTNLRLMAIQDGMLPSAVTTNTYIYKEYNFTIPVLSVTGDNEDLFGNDHGIFVKGSGNGRPGNGQSSKCNWNQDWDHPCTFEYYTPDGVRTFMQDVDICAAGGWSRAWEPHSFKLKAAKVYGINSLDYPFFEAKPYNKHKALQIRNGGNDNGCRFKDAAIQTIIQRSGIYLDGQAYQPVIHYINGQFRGVLNMREPNNKHHAYANYGYDTDLLDQFEISPDSGYVQKAGTKEAFSRMLSLSQYAADPGTYKTICDEYLDIDEYINYMACWMWLGNSDWMRNNVKAYRSTEPGGRFHYVMFDTDGSFAYSGTNGFTQLETWAENGAMSDKRYDTNNSIHLDFENAQLWMNLLQNDSFRKQFIDTYCLVCGSIFEPSRCNAILDELYNRVEPMMNLMVKQNGWWGTTAESASSTYNSLKGTLGSNSRNNTMISGVSNYSWFANETGSSRKVTFGSNIPEATILYNGIDVPTGKFTGRAFLPVTLTACAPGGYDFKGWVLKGSTSVSAETVFAQGEEWKYYDGGSLDGTDWTSASYDDSAWGRGTAPLGYDDGSSEKGVGGLLATAGLAKGPTFYFRKQFKLAAAPKDDDTYTLSFVLDDGCVVYVNGVEAGRDNMPQGSISYNQFSSTYASGNPNTGTIQIPAKLLKKGVNTIAVEVHNNSATSSDICWDGGLSATKAGEISDGDIFTTDPEITLESIGTGAELIAYYVEHTSSAQDGIVPPVRINEVSASNETYANEYFKRNDWLELYNTTDEDIDVAGYYLTDNQDKPMKYQIPTQLESGISTVIPAHGYMIVWCDKLADVSQLHATFKLSAEAACVILMSPDHKWADYFNYPAHDRNHTAGRYPDGADNAYLMTTMTPGRANCMSSYTQAYQLESLPDGFLTPVEAVEGTALTLACDGYSLTSSQTADIQVYTTSGEMLMSAPATRTVGLAALRPGIYVARAKADGQTATLKFRK